MKKLNEEKMKKLDNFWYYYKYHVLAGVFVLICIVTFIRDLHNRVDYDYSVAFVGNYGLQPEDTQNLQKWFEEKGKDLNGDGEVHVQIADYYLPDSDTANPQIYAANQTKFMADMQECMSMICFLSEENFEKLKEMGVLPVEREAYVGVSECKGFTEAGSPISVRDMIVGIRLMDEETKKSKNGERKTYFEESEKLLQKFIGE